MRSFLEEIACKVLSEEPGRLQDQVLILPNKRGCTFLKRFLGKEAGKTIWSPEIITLDELVEESVPYSYADPIAVLFDLYDVYVRVVGQEADTFDGFIKWGKTLLSDLNEVDRYMLSSEKIFSDLRQIKEVENWSFSSPELTENQQKYLDLWIKLGVIHQELSQLLKTKGAILNGEAYRMIGEQPSLVEEFLGNRKAWFIGFNALSTSEEHLFSHLVQQGKGKVFFDHDPYYSERVHHEAGLFLRKYRKKDWGREAFSLGTQSLSEEEKNIRMVGVSGNVIQAKVAGRILRDHPTSFDPDRTALVMADEGLLSPVLHSIPDKVESVNVTMGYPLEKTPLHTFFLALFKLHINAERSMGQRIQKSFYHKDIIRLMKHPYMDGFLRARTGVGVHGSIEKLQGKNRVFLDKEEFLALTEKEVRTGIEELAFLFDPWDKIPGDIMDCQRLVIERLKEVFAGEEGKDLDLEYLFKYSQILNRADGLFGKNTPVYTIRGYKRVFHQMESVEGLSFYGEPLQGLQLMGMLETRTLDFENLILLSANETVLPAQGSDDSLIPQDLRKYYGLPTRQEKDAVFAYHFYRMIQRAKNITLVYNTDPEGSGGGEMSRYLVQLLHELPRENSNARIGTSSAFLPVKVSEPEPIRIPKDENMLSRLRDWARNGISPTAISTYMNDPWDFYQKYVLRLPEPEEVQESIEARALGEVIHGVLEDLYKPHVGQVLKADKVKEMKGKVKGLVQGRFLDHYTEDDLKFGKNYLMIQVSCSLVDRFLNQEVQLLEKLNKKGEELTILSLEENITRTLQVEPSSGPLEVKVKGMADRIDRIGDRIRVIDYKTGKVEPAGVKVGSVEEALDTPEKKYALQLLIYGWLYCKEGIDPEYVEPGVISFRRLRNGMMGLSIGGKKKEKEILMSEALQTLEEALGERIRDLLDPNGSLVENEEKVY